jgi:pimeloyl-ACP methyl ester carboxylesterase
VDPVRSRRLSLLILLSVVASACISGEPVYEATTTTTETAPTSSTTTTPATVPPTTTTTVALPPAVPIAWEGCGSGLDCARVAVPVSYQDATGPTLELALVRNPADRPDQRLGTLLMNPGGPGASGVRRVTRGFRVSDEVAARFDIVGFDPRGVGDSTPITCGATVPAFRAVDLDPDSPAERTALEAAARAVADECTATEGDRIGHLGTTEVAHDVEVIRRAIGEERISFVGLSYGTLVGQLWADRYPGSVRALVLDGVINPVASGATGSVTQADGVDAVLDAIEEACAADATCPLTASGGVLASYDELAQRLESGAVTGAGVGPTQLAYAAFYATYDSETWPRLWSAIASGLDGDLRGVSDLAGSYTRLVPYAPFAIITCLDGAHPDGYADWQESGDRFARSSPRFGRVLANELLPCAFWPAATYQPQPLDAAGSPPILVIGSTGDAATPYEAAVEVAEQLDQGALLTVELDGHVALGDSDCAAERVTRYLVDLAVPGAGNQC